MTNIGALKFSAPMSTAHRESQRLSSLRLTKPIRVAATFAAARMILIRVAATVAATRMSIITLRS